MNLARAFVVSYLDMEATPSSLDRFLWERGTQLVGLNMTSRGALIALGVNAVVQFMLGSTFLMIALVTRDPEIFPAFIGLGVSMSAVGIGLGFGAYALKRRIRNASVQVRLTSEGQRFVLRIMQQVGWVSHVQRHPQPWFGFSVFAPFKTSSQVLAPKTFEILDRAAGFYNRIWGLLGIKGASPPPALERHRVSIVAAADEAMVSLINACAVLDSMPESASALEKQITMQSDQLRELAEQVEELAASEPSFTERFASPTAITSVLEQLRFESEARRELNQSSEEERLRET